LTFAENLKKIREEAGFSSAKDFANKLGIPYTTYIPYEQGREPKLSTLLSISKALNVTIEKLIGVEEKRDLDYIREIVKKILNKSIPYSLKECNEKHIILNFLYSRRPEYQEIVLETNDLLKKLKDIRDECDRECFDKFKLFFVNYTEEISSQYCKEIYQLRELILKQNPDFDFLDTQKYLNVKNPFINHPKS